MIKREDNEIFERIKAERRDLNETEENVISENTNDKEKPSFPYLGIILATIFTIVVSPVLIAFHFFIGHSHPSMNRTIWWLVIPGWLAFLAFWWLFEISIMITNIKNKIRIFMRERKSKSEVDYEQNE